MKLSKKLLGAITVGVAIASLTSCTVINKTTNSDLPTPIKDKVTRCDDGCPACGMG